MGLIDNSINPDEHFMQAMNLSGRLEPSFYVEEPHYRILANIEDDLQRIGR